MPKSEFFDYEPISRSGTVSKTNTLDPGFGESSDEGALNHNASALRTASRPADTRAVLIGEQSGRDLSVLKHGHSLSFIGLFVFTFLVYFRPYELFPSLTWLSTSAFWVATFTLICFVPTQLGLENQITIRPKEVKAVGILVVAAMLSIPLALSPSRAWFAFIEYLKVVVMFVVMVNVVRTHRRLNLLIALVFFVSCILSIGAMNDYRAGNLALAGKRIAGVVGGLFANPNDMALHLVTIIPISAVLAINAKSISKKLALTLCTLVMLGGLVVTFSRGGFLGLVFVTIVLSWKMARTNRVIVAAIAILLITLVIAVAPNAYRERIVTTNDDSAIARTDDLKRSIYIAVRHPLVGVGMENYILYSNVNKVTHNSYTQVAAEMGIPALAVYLFLLLTSLQSLRKTEQNSVRKGLRDRNYYVSIGLQASLVGFMVSSFFASVAYLWYMYYLVGYSVSFTRLSQATTESAVTTTKT